MTSIVISTIDHLTDAVQTKTISNINPNVADADLVAWVKMTDALSKDSLSSLERVDRKSLDIS